jgi:hypothetical protein
MEGLMFEVTIDNEEAPNIRYFSHMIEMPGRLPDIWLK